MSKFEITSEQISRTSSLLRRLQSFPGDSVDPEIFIAKLSRFVRQLERERDRQVARRPVDSAAKSVVVIASDSPELVDAIYSSLRDSRFDPKTVYRRRELAYLEEAVRGLGPFDTLLIDPHDVKGDYPGFITELLRRSNRPRVIVMMEGGIQLDWFLSWMREDDVDFIKMPIHLDELLAKL